MNKYERITRDDYRRWLREDQGRKNIRKDKKEAKGDPFRLAFHLMPAVGWLNDPNGLCQKDGIYHIYYQYDPFDCNGDLKLWGHYTTRDFVNYESLEPVLFPDSGADAHGVYSGSAYVEDGQIHFFYTGNVKYFDRPDYDYITEGRGSNTIHVSSGDGSHLSSKEVLLTTADYPDDISCHVRDPKILKWDGIYYMVLGARDKGGHGLVLVYRSQDLKKWEYDGRILPDEAFGYMWECPDLFELDGRLFLICCPQGVEPADVNFQNIHQCVAMGFDYDAAEGRYRLEPVKRARQLDRGCDFYAPQTFCDESGRRILIGWMGIPDADYTNPTVENGWQHALTLPRQLSWKDGRLLQMPLRELERLRLTEESFHFPPSVPAGISAGSSLCYEAELCFQRCETLRLTLREGVKLLYKKEIQGESESRDEGAAPAGLLTLELGAAGCGRPARSVRMGELNKLRIFSDASSLEIFVNDGEEVFTTRVYGEAPEWKTEGDCMGTGRCFRLGSFQIEDKERRCMEE